MYKTLLISTALLGLSTAHANGLTNQKSAFISKCNGDGETYKTCECIFNRWSSSLSASEQNAGAEFVKMFINNTPPTGANMQQMQPLMMRFQQTGMQCAQEFVGYEDTSADGSAMAAQQTYDMSSMPGGSMGGDAAALINNAANMSPEQLMASLQAMDDKKSADRQYREQQRQQARLAEQGERQKKQAEFDREIKILESRSILSQPVSSFEKAYRMRLEMSGVSSRGIDCQWDALNKAAGAGPAASLTAYFAAVGGGDFDQPDEHRPYRDEAWQRTQQHQMLSRSCQ